MNSSWTRENIYIYIYNCVERSRPVKTVGVDSHQKGSNTITGRLNYPRGDASRFDRMGLKRGSLMANHRFTGRAVVEVVRLRNRSHGVTSNVIFHEVYEAAISILGNAYTWRHRFLNAELPTELEIHHSLSLPPRPPSTLPSLIVAY